MESALYCLAVVVDVTCPNGTGIPYWTVHCSITLNGACYHGLFIGYLFPSLLYLLGPLILPEEFVWSLVDIVEKIKTKIHSFCLFHSTMLGSLQSTVLVLVEANDSDLLVSLNNAGESPLFMAVDARASEIVKTILPKSNPYSLLHRSSDGQTILHRAILRADLSKIFFFFFFFFSLF